MNAFELSLTTLGYETLLFLNQIFNMSVIWFPHHKNTCLKINEDLFLLILFPSWNDTSKAGNPETTRLRMEFQILQQTQLWPQTKTWALTSDHPHTWPLSSLPHSCFLDILAGGNKKNKWTALSVLVISTGHHQQIQPGQVWKGPGFCVWTRPLLTNSGTIQ